MCDGSSSSAGTHHSKQEETAISAFDTPSILTCSETLSSDETDELRGAESLSLIERLKRSQAAQSDRAIGHARRQIISLGRTTHTLHLHDTA